MTGWIDAEHRAGLIDAGPVDHFPPPWERWEAMPDARVLTPEQRQFERDERGLGPVRPLMRIPIDRGWIYFDPMTAERIGDRFIPSWAHVVMPGDITQPAIEMDLAVIHGVPKCVRLTHAMAPDGREVKTVDMQAAQVDAWVTSIYTVLARTIDRVDGNLIVSSLATDDATRRQTERLIRDTRAKSARKLTPEFLADVAKVYNDNLATGKPTHHVMLAFIGEEDDDEHPVRNKRLAQHYVRLARDAELIDPAPARKSRKK